MCNSCAAFRLELFQPPLTEKLVLARCNCVPRKHSFRCPTHLLHNNRRGNGYRMVAFSEVRSSTASASTTPYNSARLRPYALVMAIASDRTTNPCTSSSSRLTVWRSKKSLVTKRKMSFTLRDARCLRHQKERSEVVILLFSRGQKVGCKEDSGKEKSPHPCWGGRAGILSFSCVGLSDRVFLKTTPDGHGS